MNKRADLCNVTNKVSLLNVLEQMNQSVLKDTILSIMENSKVAEIEMSKGLILLSLLNDDGEVYDTVQLDNWVKNEKLINEFVQNLLELMGIQSKEPSVKLEVEEGRVLILLPPVSCSSNMKIRKSKELRKKIKLS